LCLYEQIPTAASAYLQLHEIVVDDVHSQSTACDLI